MTVAAMARGVGWASWIVRRTRRPSIVDGGGRSLVSTRTAPCATCVRAPRQGLEGVLPESPGRERRDDRGGAMALLAAIEVETLRRGK